MKKINLLLTVLLALGSFMVMSAQEAIVTSGGNGSGGAGSASFTVGQVFFQTASGSGGSISEGVQQPYEIMVVTSIDKGSDIDLKMAAYPNPVSDYLILNVGNNKSSTLIYQVFDLNGQLLQSKKINRNEMRINMSGYSSSLYFIKVIDDNKLLKTFKIIKK